MQLTLNNKSKAYNNLANLGLYRQIRMRKTTASMGNILRLQYGGGSSAVMALDARRWQLSHMPLWLNVAGGVLIVLGFLATMPVFLANSFAAPVVRIQEERGPRLIDRHERAAQHLGQRRAVVLGREDEVGPARQHAFKGRPPQRPEVGVLAGVLREVVAQVADVVEGFETQKPYSNEAAVPKEDRRNLTK